MVQVLRKPAHHHDRHHAIHALDPDRHAPAVDRVPVRLLVGKGKQLAERLLVAVPLAVQEPRAAAPPQHAVALPLDPRLVVGERAGPDGRLEHDLAGREGDLDHAGLLRGDGEQAGVQEVAELVGVLASEGFEGEGVAGGFDDVGLYRFPQKELAKKKRQQSRAQFCGP